MYRLRFYNVKKNEYGALYFSDGLTKDEVCSEFYKIGGRDFVIRHCANYKTIKNLSI